MEYLFGFVGLTLVAWLAMIVSIKMDRRTCHHGIDHVVCGVISLIVGGLATLVAIVAIENKPPKIMDPVHVVHYDFDEDTESIPYFSQDFKILVIKDKELRVALSVDDEKWERLKKKEKGNYKGKYTLTYRELSDDDYVLLSFYERD